jgi:hypothetical protein
MLRSTRHIELASLDYARLSALGMRAAREGVSWTRSERRPRHFDFSSVLPRLSAARGHGVQVCWDLMHFGYPDHVDIFAPDFPERMARYAGQFARFLASEADPPFMLSPINEISFFAWAGGDVRCMNPFEAARGMELKVQLVLATIQAIEAVRHVLPSARFLQPEPVIQIVPNPGQPKTFAKVESDNLLQYQTWDMLTGRVWPRLGGHPKYLDIVGVNFYPDNQFMPDGTTIPLGHEAYKPFARMLREVHARYGRPMVVSETGSEGSARAPWLRYVAQQCAEAMRGGCELHGLTLYPILNHPGWNDERHCHNGLWDYADASGEREAYEPLLQEIRRHEPMLCSERRALCIEEHELELLA